MSRLGPTGLTQLLTDIKTWITTKLGNYVTTDTTQTVTGKKLFTASAIQLDNVTSMYGSTMFIDTSASAPRGEFPAETHRVGRIYIGDGQSYNGAWFIVDPIIDTNSTCYRMVTTNPDNTDSTRFSIVWDSTKEGVRRRRNVSMGDLLPAANNTYNLGADDRKWDIGYIHNLIGSNKEDLTEDANNYYSTTSGSHMTFYTTSNGGTKLSNVPAAVNTHLESRTIRYLSSSDWIIEQICHNSFGLYYRKGTNGTWEDWKTFAFTNSNITGTAANVTGTVAIANGGTGATTRLNAVKALTNEAVASPTHFLAITTNWGKAGYTTVAQAKTVLGITGDIVSHNASEFLTAHQSLANYVTTNTDQDIEGNKNFKGLLTTIPSSSLWPSVSNTSDDITLLGGSVVHVEQKSSGKLTDLSGGAWNVVELGAGAFFFRNNNGTDIRYKHLYTGVVSRIPVVSGSNRFINDVTPNENDTYSLGTSSLRWKECYSNAYYLGTTAFGDIVTHNVSEFLTSHPSITLSSNTTSTASPAHGGTFTCIDSVTQDTNGHITKVNTKTVTLPSDSNTDTLMTQNVSTTDSTYPILLCATANATSNQGAKTGIFGSGVKVNPKTSVVSAKGFSGVPTGTTYVTAVKDGGALVNSQTTSWGAIWRAPTKDYQVAGATWSSNNNNVYICYSVTNANAEAGTNTMAKSLIWAADTGTLTTTTFSGALSGNASSATEFSANKDVTLTGDVTGTASSKAGWSVATTLANSGVTAGTYGPSADVTGSNNATILVPEITVDAKGRITAVTNRTYTSVNSDSDKKVYQYYKSDDNVYRLLFSNNAGNTATSNVGAVYSGLNNSFYVNPSTGALYATKLYSGGTEVLTSHQSLDNYVTLNSNQTITAIKTITGGNQGKMVFKNPDYNKGDANESGVIVSRLYFGNGASYDGANAVLSTSVDSSGNSVVELCAINNTANNSSRASLILSYDKSASSRLLKSWGNFLPYVDNTYTLGNSSSVWKECYCNAYYLGTTAFGDIVTHNASEFLTSHQSLSNYVTLDGTQTIAGTKTFSSTISGSISGNAGTATQFSANTTVALTGDATGTSAGSKKGWSIPVTLANSGVTAGTYGPSEDVTGNNNTTISVPQITVDAKGRVTSVTNRTYTSVNTDTNTDTKVTQTVTNDNACYPLLIANTASASHTGLEPTTETDEVRKAYNINVQARYGFIYARNSYTADNLKGSVAGGNRTSAAFYGSTYDGAIVGGVELGRVDKYGNRYSRLYATNYITDGALAPDGTAVATTFDVGVLADGTKYLNTSAGWYCNVYPTVDNTRTLGTSSLRWKECYSNAYYLGTTAFGDIVTHNASEFLTSHQSLSSCVKNVVTNSQIIKSTAITRGTAPSSAQTFGIGFSDNNNKYIGNIYGQYATDKSAYVGLYAYKGTTTSNGDNASVRVGYDASGNAYTYAPTPATADNSTQIATTAFVKAQGYLTSHQSLANYVTTNTNQSISGIKSHSKHISILGDYIGNESSTNGRSCLYLKANRDTDGKSGLYVTKFRQNVAQGSMGSSDVVFLSHDILENETRTNAGFVESYSNWANNVPGGVSIYSTIATRNLGTSAKPWTNAYITNLNLNGAAFDPTSIDGIGTTRLLAYFSEDPSDPSLAAGETKSGTSLYTVYWRLESTASVSGNLYTDFQAPLVVNKAYAATGTWKLLHSMSQVVTSKAMIGVWVRIA